jgi:hypothetical protein
LSARDLAKITVDLKLCAPKWREIGLGLGFTLDELNLIQSKPTLMNEAPLSYFSTVLSDWGHWVPDDTRTYATLDCLKTALDKAGLGREAQTLHM